MPEENIDALKLNSFIKSLEQKKYEIKRGLINFRGSLSSVCFMNSVYQALFNVPELICYILSDQYEKDKKVSGGVADAFRKLVLNIINNSGEDVLLNDLENLKAAIAKSYKEYEGNQQNDAEEFFGCLLTCLSKELNTHLKPDEEYETLVKQFGQNSDIVAKFEQKTKMRFYKEERNLFLTRLFYHWIIRQCFCVECGSCLKHKFNNENIFNMISDIYNNFETLDDGIKLSTYYKDNERVLCKKCNKEVQVYKKSRFVNAPNYLLIKKSRLEIEDENIHEIGVEHPLAFPVNDFSLGDLVINKEDQDVKYDLVSVVCHSGNASGGHYTNYSKKSDGWYYFSDGYMKKMPDDFKVNQDKNIQNNFYFLLYAIKGNERYKRLFKSFGIEDKKEKDGKPADNVDISVGKEENKKHEDDKKEQKKQKDEGKPEKEDEPIINNTESDKNLEDNPKLNIEKPVNKQDVKEKNKNDQDEKKDEIKKYLKKEKDAPTEPKVINNTEPDKNLEDNPKLNIEKPVNKQDISHEKNIKDLDYDLDCLIKTYDDMDKLRDIFFKARNQKDLFSQARKNLNSVFSEGRNRMKKLGDTKEKIDLELNKLKKEMVIYVLYLKTGIEVKKYIVDEIKKADNISLLRRIWQTIKSFIMLRFLEIGKAKQSRKLDILKYAFDKTKKSKPQKNQSDI